MKNPSVAVKPKFGVFLFLRFSQPHRQPGLSNGDLVSGSGDQSIGIWRDGQKLKTLQAKQVRIADLVWYLYSKVLRECVYIYTVYFLGI